MEALAHSPRRVVRDDTPETLLQRMRSGDREASAVFVERYGELIRLRVRDKIGSSVRRVLDSEDVLSTVARRLDGIVHDGRLRAETQGELWALVASIAHHAVLENVRTVRRDRDAAAGVVAERSGHGWASDETDLGVEDAGEVAERAMDLVHNETDRGILWLWLRDRRHTQIARSMGATPAAVRMRWGRIKRTLRALPERSAS
jgi:DNA-directed RNA polymerase specialized sigma24 family protein